MTPNFTTQSRHAGRMPLDQHAAKMAREKAAAIAAVGHLGDMNRCVMRALKELEAKFVGMAEVDLGLASEYLRLARKALREVVR